MVTTSVIDQFLSADKNLTLLRGKKPIIKNWTQTIVDKNKLYSHGGNIGWVLSENDLVVDVDPKNGGEKSFKKLLLKIGDSLSLEPSVVTPSGGFHVYLKIPEKYVGKRFKKTIKDYPGIDFLTKGSQCVIPSSSSDLGEYAWSDDIFGEFEQTTAHSSLIAIINEDNNSSNKYKYKYKYKYEYTVDEPDDLGDFEGLVGGSSSIVHENKVIDMLSKLNPSMPNDEWVKVGMALHDWDPIKGLELWEDWSKQGDNYTEGDTAARWRSFELDGGVTLGTISHMNKLAIYDDTLEQVNTYIARIKSATDEKTLEFDLLPEIRNQNLSRINREKIVKAVQDKFKELSGIKMPVGNIRQMLTHVDIVSGTFIEDCEKPDWCKDWIYVNSHSGFIDVQTLMLHKSESFNVENGKFVPMSESGTKPSATKYVSDRGFVEKVDTIAYLPMHKELVCSIGGLTVLNSFKSKSIPKEADYFSDEGLTAINLIKNHIKFICTTDNDADTFTQWLAHQIQFPGRQILWSPVIQSIQGVGKSFFGELLRSCLGDRNVGTVSPTQVTSDFNGWATDVVVNVLEELRVKGHNRFDTVNALKPLITDRMIQINEKGVKQYMTYNTTNYLCFTNYKDSLPLDGDDRRWWVIFVPIQSLSELEQYVKEEASTYFPKLFRAARSYGSEIRKWLLEYKISEKFLNTKQAPMTEHKKTMIATEDASIEGLTELRDLIDIGGKYFNKNVISSPDLFEALMFERPDIEFKSTQRHVILKKLGYMLLANPVKIDGKARRIWTKKSMEPKEARNLLRQNFEEIDDL